ncbi:DUF2357 domain-containing protein [Desulfovibrio subterraneus]|uniref:DUF2357 domain-containing protein n=1 Tax=Desulfovibrio subterraneus TaxID=2718620 RepID=A0A7J0BKL7_9BACT|nr:DUF2357 domain-containing protein [Desulfovibrio subterraneus]GFM33732.1 hypothetical protein DSM101010T_20970 [Desulfovibrio subterraneus]
MNGVVAVQLHLWPWSVGNRDETVDLINGEVNARFYGSPVLSVTRGAEVLLAKRYERFIPFGPEYASTSGPCQLYQTPHGVIAQKYGLPKSSQSKIAPILAVVPEGRKSEQITLRMDGAASSLQEREETQGESQLYNAVLAWSNYFDECIRESSGSKRQGKLPWSNILVYLKTIALQDEEPRMALIVHIAERMRRQLPQIVHAARRILVRERTMIPAPRVAETDAACLRWYIRQPGTTSTQKAAANRHRLLAVTRKESLDTLENMVLKDFLKRCTLESARYLNFDCTADQRTQSERGRNVNSFGHICADLGRLPQMEYISSPPASIRPNYVLQNDYRYKNIWELYRKLLHREDEKDRLWDWQAHTWADIARMLVSAALISLEKESGGAGAFQLTEILESVLVILQEQRLGARLDHGSEPGPFLVKSDENGQGQGVVLEIVHPTLAHEHESTKDLGRMGGHLYLVFTPLDGSSQTVLVLWAVHTAGCDPLKRPRWDAVSESAAKALERHKILIGERASKVPNLRAFVLASDLEARAPELHSSPQGTVHLIQVPTNQMAWNKVVEYLALVLEEVMESLV